MKKEKKSLDARISRRTLPSVLQLSQVHKIHRRRRASSICSRKMTSIDVDLPGGGKKLLLIVLVAVLLSQVVQGAEPTGASGIAKEAEEDEEFEWKAHLRNLVTECRNYAGSKAGSTGFEKLTSMVGCAQKKTFNELDKILDSSKVITLAEGLELVKSNDVRDDSEKANKLYLR